jgi:hypothetical protein
VTEPLPSHRFSQKSSQRLREAKRGKRYANLAVPFLRDDAPIGTYHIDGLADDLIAFGLTPSDRAEFIVTIRTEIYRAAVSAVRHFERKIHKEPPLFRKIKRFFKDTSQIEKLIRRNEGLDVEDIESPSPG